MQGSLWSDRLRAVGISMLSAVLLGATACERTTDLSTAPSAGVVVEGDIVRGDGVVRWFDFEGGFYAILGDDGVKYDPLALPAEFRHSGLKVRFVARLRGDMVNYHMAGPIVELVQIQRR